MNRQKNINILKEYRRKILSIKGDTSMKQNGIKKSDNMITRCQDYITNRGYEVNRGSEKINSHRLMNL